MTGSSPSHGDDEQLIRSQIADLHWSRQEWGEWLAGLVREGVELQPERVGDAELLARRAIEQLGGRAKRWPDELIESAVRGVQRYRDLAVFSALLLALLASGPPAAQQRFADLLSTQPPANAATVGLCFQPLFRHPARAAGVFPRLLDALSHPSVAAAVLDLANFLTRKQLVTKHPALERRSMLVDLLGQLVRRLEYFEEETIQSEEHYREVARQVAEATAITIALCDALALMGGTDVIPKLYPLLELRHRRLQVEAAAALARLGEATGQQRLIELAAEPVVRLHAVQYAEELGLDEQIAAEFRTDEALAAGRAALALSQPIYFGVPPSQLEVIDRRRLPWPGFEEPVDAFLVRYAYSMEEGSWSNIACVGPSVGICTADLGDLAPDDIYAVFAGMEIAHEDIRYWDAGEWTELHRAEVARLERRLRDEGYRQIVPHLLGNFFGEWLLVAGAEREGTKGVVVVDERAARWFASTGQRPLGVAEVYALYKGRRLLETFGDEHEQDL